MKTMQIGHTALQASRIAFGCLRLSANRGEAISSIKTALDQGINFFDHADVYANGAQEEMFSATWSEIPGLRQRIILQSKCGIRLAGDPDPNAPKRYDFSYEHILRAAEGSLRRLKTDYLDILLLHRPDMLMEPDEVARAFEELQRAGKVRYFGVSNFSAAQMEMLQRALKQPLVVNQLLVNVLESQLLEIGVNLSTRPLLNKIKGYGTLEYCWLNSITIQAWSPLAGGQVTGKLPNEPEPRIVRTAEIVAELAQAKNVSSEAIVIAWLLRHPAGIQPIIGTMNPARIRAACQADEVQMSREEWYRLFVAGRGGDIP